MDFRMWLQSDEDEKSALTVEGYVRDVAIYARWYEERNGQALTPAGLSRVDAQEYRDELRAARMMPAAINRRLAALRAYVRYGQAMGALRENFDPLARVANVEQQRTGPRWLERKEQNRVTHLVENALNDTRAYARLMAARDMACIALMRYAGLRVAELCALTVGDVQLDPDYGMVMVRNGKGGKHREVPLHGEAVHAVQEWLTARPNGGGDFLFIGKRGEPMRPRGVQRRLQAIGRAVGVKVTPHTLRHTFGKELVRAGANLNEVRDLLGHANLNVTAIYTQPDANDLRRAVAQMP